MSVEVYVAFNAKNFPNRNRWQAALRELSFNVLLPQAIPFNDGCEYLSVEFEGGFSGFEFSISSIKDFFESSFLDLLGDRDRAAVFTFHTDLTELACALCSAAAFAACTDGVLIEDGSDECHLPADAAKLARNHMKSFMPPPKKRRPLRRLNADWAGDLPEFKDIVLGLRLLGKEADSRVSPAYLQDQLKRMSEVVNLLNIAKIIETIRDGKRMPSFDILKGRTKFDRMEPDEAERHFEFSSAVVLFWWCNVANDLDPQAQWDYVVRQSQFFPSTWAQVVSVVDSQKTKALMLECLRNGYGGLAFKDSYCLHRKFWGDAESFVELCDFEKWEGDSKENFMDVLGLSANRDYKVAIMRSLLNDESVSRRRKARNYLNSRALLGIDLNDVIPE